MKLDCDVGVVGSYARPCDGLYSHIRARAADGRCETYRTRRELTLLQMSIEAPLHRSELRTDPLSRCAALLLPKDSLAILPFLQSQAELDISEQEHQLRFVSLFRG